MGMGEPFYNQYRKALASLLSASETTLVKTNGTEVTLVVIKITVSTALIYQEWIDFDPNRAVQPPNPFAEMQPVNKAIIDVGKYKVDYAVTPTQGATISTMIVKALVNDTHEILMAHVNYPEPVTLQPNVTTAFRFIHSIFAFPRTIPTAKIQHEPVPIPVCSCQYATISENLYDTTPIPVFSCQYITISENLYDATPEVSMSAYVP